MTGESYTSGNLYTNGATITIDGREFDRRPFRCAVCGRFIGKRGKPLAIAWRKGRYLKMRHHDCAPSDTRREREHGE